MPEVFSPGSSRSSRSSFGSQPVIDQLEDRIGVLFGAIKDVFLTVWVMSRHGIESSDWRSTFGLGG
jgi:hypothetical protein